MSDKCEKCGSEKIVPMAGVLDQGQYSDGKLKAVVYTNPEAWIFKGLVSAQLTARICGECGHTELTAQNPSAIYKAYVNAQKGS